MGRNIVRMSLEDILLLKNLEQFLCSQHFLFSESSIQAALLLKTQTIKHAQKEFSNSKVTTQNVEKAYTVVTKISTLRKTWDLIVFEEGDSCQYFKKCQM